MLDILDKRNPNLRKKLVSPFLKKVDPNSVSFIAFIFAVFAGASFWYGGVYNNPICYVVGAIFVLLNGYFDIVDGAIARKYGATKYGDFLDHSLDRLADVAILLGIALNPIVPMEIGFMTIIMILLVSYLGTEAQALTKKRLYGGLAGRADRLIIIAAMGILAYFSRYYLVWGTLLILILAVMTFIQRSARIRQILIG